MGSFSGPEINEDGLVFAVDAANSKSNTGSPTFWSNLMPNNPSSGGKLELNGVSYDSTFNAYYFCSPNFGDSNAYTLIGNGYTDFGTADFTISIWCYITGVSAEENYIFDLRSYDFNTLTANTNNYNLIATSTTNYRLRFNTTNRETLLSLSSSTWNNFVFSRIGGDLYTYINGEYYDVAFGGDNATSDQVMLGDYYTHQGSGAPNSGFTGYISNFMIYKGRGLTASEIKQNFIALKGRFGK
jgi:hypothetical protein